MKPLQQHVKIIVRFNKFKTKIKIEVKLLPELSQIAKKIFKQNEKNASF